MKNLTRFMAALLIAGSLAPMQSFADPQIRVSGNTPIVIGTRSVAIAKASSDITLMFGLTNTGSLTLKKGTTIYYQYTTPSKPGQPASLVKSSYVLDADLKPGKQVGFAAYPSKSWTTTVLSAKASFSPL